MTRFRAEKARGRRAQHERDARELGLSVSRVSRLIARAERAKGKA